ncbi:MAG: patatin-like phospholipase family protein [Clostridia bacterium]|nr:patatin-like phospholipase family protein [Clostridia bacterium]MBQ5957091.1 patatin-like phospholipase family protein [Clostridia bacterium]
MENRKTVGLSLGAGASRGFAHIGVLKTFIKHGIPIDIITGTSMGALVAGLYAAGNDIGYIEDLANNISMSKIMDFSIKDGGFLKGKRAEELLRAITGNKSIEQLKIPFSCAAISLSTGKVRHFDRGGLCEAIRASISMPGIFAPYRIGDDLYIDGGPVARLPFKKTREMGAEVLIGVDVAWRGQTSKTSDNPNPISVLQSAINFAAWEITQLEEQEADVMITPDVYDINPFSPKECEKCIRIGEETAEKAVDRIKELIRG